MAKQDKKSDKKPAPASKVKKPAGKPRTKPTPAVKGKKAAPPPKKPSSARRPTHAAKPARTYLRPEPPRYILRTTPTVKRAEFLTPSAVIALLAGIVLFAIGVYYFTAIQYGGGDSNNYMKGCAFFIAGLILPCIGVPGIRSFLIPRRLPEDDEIIPADGTESKTSDTGGQEKQ